MVDLEELLRPVQRVGKTQAETRWALVKAGQTTLSTCGVVMTRGRRAGEACLNPAGLNTPNAGDAEEPGVGPCWAHGGAKLRGRAEAGWIMAHRFAQELNVSPWEGLLRAVRIAAGKVAYIEWVLSQASDDLELEGRIVRSDDGLLVHPDTGMPLGAGALRDLSWWVRKGELWTDRLARYSKAAIDAGVAERLVEIERTHAEWVAQVLNGVLSRLETEGGLDDDTMLRMRSIMRQQLLALDEAPREQVVDGQVV